jgi:hypothetical protein
MNNSIQDQANLEEFLFEVQNKLAVTEIQSEKAIVRTVSVNCYQLFINGKIESAELCDKFSELLLEVGV